MRRVLYYSPANKVRSRNSQTVSTCICHAFIQQFLFICSWVSLIFRPKLPILACSKHVLSVVANQVPQMGMYTENLNLCHISPMPKE